MQVRVRADYDAEGHVVGEVPLTPGGLEAVIPLLDAWGVEDSDGTTYDRTTMSGTVQYGPNGCWFEIVLLQPDDA